MSEIICRYTAVALPETFEINVPEDESKHPQISVRLRVVEGDEVGKEIVWYGSLHPNSQEITGKGLRAMGWTCNDITAQTGLGSTKVAVTGKNNTYKGKTRVQYSVWPLNNRPTLRAEDQASFAVRYKAMAAGLKSEVVTISDANRAPETLPPPRVSEDKLEFPPKNGESDPTALFG